MKIGYARVSTTDQHLYMQEDALKSDGCEKIFHDIASGAKSDRPGLDDALAYAREGDVLAVWKLDRLARNPVDGGQVQWLLQQSVIKHIQTHDRSHYPNDNVLMMSVELGMANEYVRQLSANTARGLRQKARRGEFPGVAPVGYLNDVRSKTIVVDRKKGKAIRAAFELYARGNSRFEDISRFLHENGVRSLHGNPLHKDRARFILANPFYYGVFFYRGEMYEGKHTPLVEKHLFDKVQAVLAKRGHPQSPEKEPKALVGLLKCGECGMSITAEKQKGHIYYRCTKKKGGCSQPYIREEELSGQLSNLLSRFVLPKEHANAMLLMADKDEKQAQSVAAASVQDLRATGPIPSARPGHPKCRSWAPRS